MSMYGRIPVNCDRWGREAAGCRFYEADNGVDSDCHLAYRSARAAKACSARFRPQSLRHKSERTPQAPAIRAASLEKPVARQFVRRATGGSRMIISRTPYRISFFGGGTDYPSWYQVHGGAVLAATIDKYCYLTCRHLPPFFEHRSRIVYSKIESCVTNDE